MKQLVEGMSPEPSSWTWNPVPWTQSELDPSVNFSDQTTSSSDNPELVTTGLRAITQKVLNSLIQFLMSLERKLKDAIVYKVSKSLTLSVVVLDPVWEPSSSQRSEKNILTESCAHSPLCHPPRSQIPSLNPTTLPSPSTSWSKMPMRLCVLITKLFTISVSELLSSPPPPMVILTTWSQLPSQVSLAASDSQVNSTLISENLLSTWFPSPDFISSWLDSLPWPLEDLNNTELLPFPNSPNKCSMLKTWCAHQIPDTEDI